jgi:hypothetical protein
MFDIDAYSSHYNSTITSVPLPHTGIGPRLLERNIGHSLWDCSRIGHLRCIRLRYYVILPSFWLVHCDSVGSRAMSILGCIPEPMTIMGEFDQKPVISIDKVGLPPMNLQDA